MTKKISLILLIIWMIVIFLFSSMPGSSSNTASKMIINTVLDKTNIVEKKVLMKKNANSNKSLFDKIHYLARKNAHFFEYFILAILLLNYLRFYKKSKYIKIIFCIIFCFLYSITDELHQMITPNRTPLFTDCLIDTSGAITACLTILIITQIYNKIKQNNYLKQNS